MKQILSYSCYFLLCALVLSACRQDHAKLPGFVPSFSKSDRQPFGSNVAYEMLPQLFPDNSIFVKRQNFEKTWREVSNTNALYISISENLILSASDRNAMMQYANVGNTIFIAANYIDTKLLDTLGCMNTQYANPLYLMPDLMSYTHLSLAPQLYKDSTKYGYFYYHLTNKFVKVNKDRCTVLGYSEDGEPDFITCDYGRGKFFFNVEANAFSNYFLLQKNNYRYLQKAFAFTPDHPEEVYWDDFYCKKNNPSDDGSDIGSFSFLTRYPALRWAFWLSLSLLFLYIFFGGKRRQRIIEIIPPNTNTTVAFTETVGRLYLQKKDNRNIADKLILYFFEHLRTQYFLNAHHINDDMIATLSRKSNVSLDDTKKLFSTIRLVQNNYDVGDQQLLSLSRQIEKFNKTKT